MVNIQQEQQKQKFQHMKKIYFISAIMMLVCTAIMAQQESRLTVPRPSAPGVEFSNGTPVKANRNLKKIKKAAIETAEQVPTTLIELGYMSNPSEDRKMQTASYQKKMVKGLSNGIRKYLITG